ncbi:lipopolysaccharide heptosyltransferase II [Tepidiphilus olei]|uniref:lipopolysaccharide heptosyltransferase II n=1 Tax=Tepidiphilus olei TaxID=2502184 RepID=UPI00115E7FB7|nr:lipopolysaccharide heptosyltransferase II [Tepidiphilus olei]
MTNRQILIIGPSWVGDMILAQSLFKLLKQQDEHCAIDVAAPAWTLPLLERMPEVRQAIALPFRHGKLDLWQRIRLGRALRAQGYAQAIVLPNSFKSAILPFVAGIPRRTGFRGEMRYGLLNDLRLLDTARLPMTVQRFVALGLPPGAPLPDPLPRPSLIASPGGALQALHCLGREQPDRPVLGLCPGAEYGPAKRWPEEHYAAVARWALEQGHEVWLFGSAKDAPVTRAIDHLSGNRCLDLGGKTRLGEAIDLMSLCAAVVSNDSGLMHVAAALDRPLVALYGSSDPNHTPPMSERASIIHLGLPCSPCFARECPLDHLKCLRDIEPERVIELLQSILPRR